MPWTSFSTCFLVAAWIHILLLLCYYDYMLVLISHGTRYTNKNLQGQIHVTGICKGSNIEIIGRRIIHFHFFVFIFMFGSPAIKASCNGVPSVEGWQIDIAGSLWPLPSCLVVPAPKSPLLSGSVLAL